MAAASNGTSAKRNNQAALFNDLPDLNLVDAIFAMAGKFEAWEECFDKAKGLFIAQQVEKGFALASATPATWQAFLKHEFWVAHPKRKPGTSDQADALRYTLRIFFSGTNSGGQRANEIWVAAQQLSREYLTPTQILTEFKTGLSQKGMDLKAVCRRAAEFNRWQRSITRGGANEPEMTSPHAVATTKTCIAESGSGKPKEQREDSGSAQSIQLHFLRGLGEFAGLHKCAEVRVKLKIVDVVPSGYIAEVLKVRANKPT